MPVPKPGSRDGRLRRHVIRQPEGCQRDVESFGGALGQGLLPDRKTEPFQHLVADPGGIAEPKGQTVQQRLQRGGITARELRKELAPAGQIQQRRVGGKLTLPAGGNHGKSLPVAAQQADQPDHAALAGAAEQHLGERGTELPVRRGQDLASMNEVDVEARHAAERQEMVVPFLRRCRGDRDVPGPRPSAGDQLACPAECLERFVPRAGTALPGNVRCFRRSREDSDSQIPDPVRHMAGAGGPAQFGCPGEGTGQAPPDRGHFRAAPDLDRPEQGPCMPDARQGNRHEIGRPQHRRRQMPQQGGFELEDGGKTWRRLGGGSRQQLRQIEAGTPGFRQGPGGGPRKARQIFDLVQFPKVGLYCL